LSTIKDPRAHAAAKADINKEVQLKVRELKSEAAEIDGRIRECEIAATRETDDDRVAELLAERSRLQQRKEALPFLLRGTQARALQRQAEALFAEAADIKVDLDAAEEKLQAATACVPDLQRQLDEAIAAVKQLTAQRDQLSLHYNSLTKSAGLARADAGCIERGEPMKFGSNGYIGE
jgi:chromosome segregation ATPase